MAGKKEPRTPKKSTTTRNYDKYAYLTIALDRNSLAYQGILEDAAKINSKHYPTIAALRLADYYEMKKTGTLYRIGDATPAQEAVEQPEEEPDSRVKLDKAKSDENADEAADLW